MIKKNYLKNKLESGKTVIGTWCVIPSPIVIDIICSAGLDFVIIDAEHGHLDWKDINSHIRAALRSDTVVLVRIAERSTTLSKRALDIGADGIVIPWMEKVEEVEA